MDPYSSPYIIPNSNPFHPFPPKHQRVHPGTAWSTKVKPPAGVSPSTSCPDNWASENMSVHYNRNLGIRVGGGFRSFGLPSLGSQ